MTPKDIARMITEDPDVPTKAIRLYHGTSSLRLKDILSNGLNPQAQRMRVTAEGASGIYLATDPSLAMEYAFEASAGGDQDAAIVAVDVPSDILQIDDDEMLRNPWDDWSQESSSTSWWHPIEPLGIEEDDLLKMNDSELIDVGIQQFNKFLAAQGVTQSGLAGIQKDIEAYVVNLLKLFKEKGYYSNDDFGVERESSLWPHFRKMQEATRGAQPTTEGRPTFQYLVLDAIPPNDIAYAGVLQSEFKGTVASHVPGGKPTKQYTFKWVDVKGSMPPEVAAELKHHG